MRTGFLVRRVRHNGDITWNGHHLYVSEVLAQKPLGLKPVAEDLWKPNYSFQRLGIWNLRSQVITQPEDWHRANLNKT